jgi:Ca2+-binding EF-hand superfamily protein
VLRRGSPHSPPARSMKATVSIDRPVHFSPACARKKLNAMGTGASTPRTTWHLAQASEEVAIRAFEELDADGSQTLTFKEIRAGVAKRGAAIRADWPDELIAKTIRIYDQDKDGALSRVEFCAALRDMEERKPGKPSAAKRLFDVIDADGNGKIDRAEACLVADALKCSPESFWQLLLRYSKAVPGKIVYPEFMAALNGKLFVEFFRTSGYHATDAESLCHKAIEQLAQHPTFERIREYQDPAQRTWSFKSEAPIMSEEEAALAHFSVADAMKDAIARRAAKAAEEAAAAAKAEEEEKAKAAALVAAEPSVIRRARQAAKVKEAMEQDSDFKARIQAKLKEAEAAVQARIKQRAKEAEQAKEAEAARVQAEEAKKAEQARKADEWIQAEKAKLAPAREALKERERQEAAAKEEAAAEARRQARLAEVAAETQARHAEDEKLNLKSRLGDIDPNYKAPAARLKM